MRLDSAEFIQWLLLALPISVGASLFITGRYGTMGNLGVAVLGGLAGGLVAASLRLESQAGLLVSILATVVGAVMLSALARAIPSHSRA